MGGTSRRCSRPFIFNTVLYTGLTGWFYNGYGICSLRGTNWGFVCSLIMMHVSPQRANHLLGTLHAKIMNLCSSLGVQERVSHLCKIKGMFQSSASALLVGRPRIPYWMVNKHSSKSLCSQHFCKLTYYDVFLVRRQPHSRSTSSQKSRMEQRLATTQFLVICDTAFRHQQHLF